MEHAFLCRACCQTPYPGTSSLRGNYLAVGEILSPDLAISVRSFLTTVIVLNSIYSMQLNRSISKKIIVLRFQNQDQQEEIVARLVGL